jgi:hypothetical protein
MLPELESLALAQETYIVEQWLKEQGADPTKHILLRFLDYENGITYVLADAETARPMIDAGTVEPDAAKARWPFLYVKPDLNRPERDRLAP